MYSKEEIIYPVFLKCCNLCENNFWVNIFVDLSKGITPYGTYISKDYFCCSYKNKEFSYKISNEADTEKLYADVIYLLKHKLKLTSLNEKLEQINTLKSKNKKEETWNSIRKRSTRKMLLEKYVVEQASEHNLSLKERKKLLNLIYYFTLIKSLSHKDFIMENKKIVSIKGISFEPGRVVIDSELKEINVYDTSIKKTKNTMHSNWTKYLKEIHKVSQSLE